ncbi:MAG TPA: hypothetical protein VFG63_13290 [Nocardioidaceae bacterium]|nr:hypothetical protein [Nocardioidaceae bacterium]
MVSDDSRVTSVVLPLPIRELWPYFREPELIREWHGWEYDGLGDEIQEIYLDTATISEDHRTLHLGSHLFNFFEDDGATRLDVHRAPLSDDSAWAPFVADIDEGWTSFVQQLRFLVERHRGEHRHTIFYGGAPKDPAVSPVRQLGLGQVRLQDVGAPYVATVGTGDALTGTVWFTAPHQLGLTVDAWGDGLLVVGDGTAAGPPYAKGEAILTTYGLDDRARAALAERWSSWWSAHY